MVIGNNITSENLIIVKELINNWRIASTYKKKKIWKIRVNSTQLATFIFYFSVFSETHNKKTCLKNFYLVFIFNILKVGFEYKKNENIFSSFSFSFKTNTVEIS